MRTALKRIFAPLLIATCSTLFGNLGLAQWSVFSDHRLLENKSIIAAVEIEQIRSGSTSRQVYQTNFVSSLGRRVCFTMSSSKYWGYGKKAGLVLADAQRNYWIAILDDGIGTIDATVHVIVLQPCP